jgi:hypothetical protein
MAGGAAKSRWGRVLRYTFGGAVFLLVGINVLVGSPWYLCLIGAVFGGMIIVGQRRIFRIAVSRSGDEIVCRYMPGYEGNAYIALVLVPLMGFAAIAAGSAPGSPALLRWVGIVLLGVTLLIVDGIVRIWRRSLLCITPSTLTVRQAERRSELTEIRRELVESIEPKRVPQAVSGTSLQVAIVYWPFGVGIDATKTVMLGLQLTVPPVNLLNALVAWKDGVNDNPSELLDRIERILRGRSMAGV